MDEFLYKIIPLILASGVSEIIYLMLDKNYKVTDKINSKLHIKQEWKAPFCICCCFMSLFIICVLGIYVIEIQETVYFIIAGLMMGITYIVSERLKIYK